MALALIVFGARLVVFDYAGSPLPYYDQWIAEFYNLFFAIIAGGNPSALFSWHNEHILFTTRILSLFGFLINGYWDVAFLAACSAAIRAIVAATAFRLLTQYADHKSTALIWGLCVLAFALPVSGYNALSGLQVSFYLTDLSAIAAIGLLLNWPGCRLGPPLLVLLSLAGLFSMASGLVIPIVTLGVHLATRMVRQGFWPAWIITGIAAIAYTIPILARGQLPDAGSAQEPWTQFSFALRLFSWPILEPLIGILIAALVALGIRRIFANHEPSKATGALVGLGLYATAGAILLAVSRSPSAFHHRHWDILTLMPLTWLAIGFVIISRPSAQRNLPLRLLIYGASAIYALNITILYKTVSLPYIQEARIHRTEAIEHYRQILLSKDRLQDERDRLNASLQAKDYSFFDDPLGRFSLHPFVAHYMAYFGTFDGSSTHALLSPEILHHRPVSLFSRLLTILRRNGWALICAGFLLALSAMRRAPSYS